MNVRASLTCTLVAITASVSPAGASSFAATGFGGFQGNHFVNHTSGDSLEYSENPAIVFNEPIAFASFKYTLVPAAPAPSTDSMGTMPYSSSSGRRRAFSTS